MLYEIYQNLTTPCPRPFKEIGYLRQTIGMAARYRRCREAWRPHLERCGEWITGAMEGSRGRAVVLGSGLLLDLPLASLSDHFEEVVLVDIVHMPAAIKTARAFANVRLERRDITGLAEPLYRHARGGPSPLAGSVDIPHLEDAGLIISLNILSQLAVLPLEFAARKGLALEGKPIIEAHLDALAGAAGRVCLITEVEQRLCLNGRVIESNDPLAGVAVPETLKAASTHWQWNFAPRPERHPRYDLTCRVEGYLR